MRRAFVPLLSVALALVAGVFVVRQAAAGPPPVPRPHAPAAGLVLLPSTLPSGGGRVSAVFTSRNAVSCTLASSPALWSGADPAKVKCKGTHTLELAPTAGRRQWTLTFRATGRNGKSATVRRRLTESAPLSPPIGANSSWAGYVVPSTAVVTSVSGDFVVPTLNCAVTPDGTASVWVGTGGYPKADGSTSGVLLQTGVTGRCSSGERTYVGWYEEYPSTPGTEQDFSGFSISPGDRMAVSVFRLPDGSHWETCLEDVTTGLSGLMITGGGWGVTSGGCDGSFAQQGSTASLVYAGGSTAEWIVEDPGESTSTSLVPFANFGTVAFTKLRTSLSVWYLGASEQVTIVQGNAVLAIPSAPEADGFTVTYLG